MNSVPFCSTFDADIGHIVAVCRRAVPGVDTVARRCTESGRLERGELAPPLLAMTLTARPGNTRRPSTWGSRASHLAPVRLSATSRVAPSRRRATSAGEVVVRLTSSPWASSQVKAAFILQPSLARDMAAAATGPLTAAQARRATFAEALPPLRALLAI